MTVATLITANSPDTYLQCTLTLDSLRVGFPTADISVTVNCSPFAQKHREEIYLRCKAIDTHHQELLWPAIHHADWIRDVLARTTKAPVVIVDPDCIFWMNCEWFDFPGLLAGMYVPDHWNHWSRSAYRARLHTSFLWIKDPGDLNERIKSIENNHAYLPCNPLRPVLVYDYGRPTFYDTLAILCHALPKPEVNVFEETHLDCYDHLNCASFYHEMLERWETEEQRAEFARIHKLATDNPKELRGLWRKTQSYYNQMHDRLMREHVASTAWGK